MMVAKKIKKPVKKTTKKAKAPVKKSRPALKQGKRILVVDDEADIRSTVKKVLEKEGFTVTTAENGDDALKKEKNGKFHLILLDIMMPGTPVKEVVTKVKTPVAFLSVVRTSDEEKKALLAQPNVKAFLQKPFDVKELVQQVRKLT